VLVAFLASGGEATVTLGPVDGAGRSRGRGQGRLRQGPPVLRARGVRRRGLRAARLRARGQRRQPRLPRRHAGAGRTTTPTGSWRTAGSTPGCCSSPTRTTRSTSSGCRPGWAATTCSTSTSGTSARASSWSRPLRRRATTSARRCSPEGTSDAPGPPGRRRSLTVPGGVTFSGPAPISPLTTSRSRPRRSRLTEAVGTVAGAARPHPDVTAGGVRDDAPARVR
jgi:hypothetical protein